MPLSVTCPRCESNYQLDANMRGKRMRCPNTICRAVFEVRDDSDPLPGPTEPVVAPPVMPIPDVPPPVVARSPDPSAEEPASAGPTPAAPVEPKPEALPPPRRVDPPKRKPVPMPLEPTPDFGDDFPGDDEPAPASAATAIATEAWQPDVWESPRAPEEAAPAPVAIAQATEPAPRQRSAWRAVWIIAGMLIMLGIVAGVGVWRVRGTIETNEAETFQKADELYKKPDFAEASAAFQKLYREFPDSPHNKKYRFLAELSDVRLSAYAREGTEETVKALERVLQLAGMYQGDPLLKEREADIWQTLNFLSTELTACAEREKSPYYLPMARRAWAEAKKRSPPSGGNPGERERKLTQEWKRIEALLNSHAERQHLIATIRKQLPAPTAPGVREARTLAEKTRRSDEPEIRALLNELSKAHRERVIFVPTDPGQKARPLDDDPFPSLSVTPRVQSDRGVKTTGPPILALARGVLYALEPTKGELRWARRVGIDTSALPLRVPADSITPELALVFSSDQRSVAAVIMETGATLWITALEGACLGTPVLVDRTLLVPTVAGKIEEIEVAEGRRVGAYQVGQPFQVGGVRLPGTSLAYFPADEYCLYEIDVTKRICTNILYTRHAAGSLLGLPALYSGDKQAWLLQGLATGLNHAAVKAYALPIQNAEQRPVAEADLPGVSTRPWFGTDRFAIMTESGFLSPRGVRQPGTRDPLLFRHLKQDFLVDPARRAGRCVIAYADRYNYWPMTHGQLHRVQAIFDASKGPDLVATWPAPIRLGTLLHRTQARTEGAGGDILYLTTQDGDRPVCLASAVEANTGKILWQRQLGVMPQQAPLVANGTIYLNDAGGVIRFDSGQLSKKPQPAWRELGERLLPASADGASRILLANEKSYFVLSWPASAMKLRVEIGSLAGGEKPRAFDVGLSSAIQGTPALGDGFLLIPLASGIVVRVNLQDGAFINGPDWRAAGAEEQARGHIAVLNAREFVLSDGSRGLSRMASADGKLFDRRATVQLSHRVMAAPVVVPAAGATPAALCVLDASDTLTLLDADRLAVVRRWPVSGKVTAGPFVRGGKIGCIVGRTRLVWHDPDKDEPIWAYSFADVVGAPNLIDGVLVVADVAGQLLALDPASGRPLGPGVTLRANVAPTAAPVAFGPGRAFVPLTDGTILLLPLEKLR
ncbi:MAG: PQQ-binding-like beta-propeller repeat protein [Planctomycetes bacterium]|nr:PQQ-binding-like beta-propeller repeat protein [Planctomycetota bacterium]